MSLALTILQLICVLAAFVCALHWHKKAVQAMQVAASLRKQLAEVEDMSPVAFEVWKMARLNPGSRHILRGLR